MHPHHSFGPFSGAVNRVVARSVDAVIANSQAAGEVALRDQSVPPAKLRVIRNGVELIEPLSGAVRDCLRAELGASDRDFVIGCVGNLRPDKRHDLLISVFASLVERNPNLRLVVVGEGETRAQLEGQIDRLGVTERVRLLGTVADVRPLYGAFDLVVQASRTEGMPNVLLEAAAAGRPIVATAAGGSVEIVRDGETGLLVEVDDGAALGAAIGRMVEDEDVTREPRRGRARACRRIVRDGSFRARVLRRLRGARRGQRGQPMTGGAVHEAASMNVVVVGVNAGGLLAFRGDLLREMAGLGHHVLALVPNPRTTRGSHCDRGDGRPVRHRADAKDRNESGARHWNDSRPSKRVPRFRRRRRARVRGEAGRVRIGGGVACRRSQARRNDHRSRLGPVGRDRAATTGRRDDARDDVRGVASARPARLLPEPR